MKKYRGHCRFKLIIRTIEHIYSHHLYNTVHNYPSFVWGFPNHGLVNFLSCCLESEWDEATSMSEIDQNTVEDWNISVNYQRMFWYWPLSSLPPTLFIGNTHSGYGWWQTELIVDTRLCTARWSGTRQSWTKYDWNIVNKWEFAERNNVRTQETIPVSISTVIMNWFGWHF